IETSTPDAGDLIEIIEAGVSHRRFNTVVALMLDAAASDDVRSLLVEHLKLGADDVWTSDGPLALADLMELYKPDRPRLKDPDGVGGVAGGVQETADIFAAIRQGDIWLEHPFDAYGVVVEYIRQAARDPDVLGLKQTVYRVGKHSAIIDALL